MTALPLAESLPGKSKADLAVEEEDDDDVVISAKTKPSRKGSRSTKPRVQKTQLTKGTSKRKEKAPTADSSAKKSRSVKNSSILEDSDNAKGTCRHFCFIILTQLLN